MRATVALPECNIVDADPVQQDVHEREREQRARQTRRPVADLPPEDEERRHRQHRQPASRIHASDGVVLLTLKEDARGVLEVCLPVQPRRDAVDAR